MAKSFILYGQPNSGKKSLINRLHGNEFTTSYLSLIEMGNQCVTNFSQENISLEYHDREGFERFADNQGKFSGNKKVLICVSAEESIEHARDAIKQAHNRIKKTSNRGGVPIIVITKTDSEKRQLSSKDIQELSSHFNLKVIETDAKRENVREEFFVQVLNSVANLKASDSKIQFITAHQALLMEEKSVCLVGMFRRTNVNYYQDLSEIIKHAQTSNNRSRQVCVSLGWMNRDGSLTNEAPNDVKAAAKKDDSTPTARY
ncbi:MULTISPECIES: hypothetical protein [unclassified Legionella]|uniref:hypothetical protein n=1 Tax=unclassified Legionella TaxID=2622702 RepID=UPI0010565782|nr:MULTISPECIES: hypothetical protein [unclassified Legionella]MDI9818602.1 hypothetical protein [Legionella sp. PL877]